MQFGGQFEKDFVFSSFVHFFYLLKDRSRNLKGWKILAEVCLFCRFAGNLSKD